MIVATAQPWLVVDIETFGGDPEELAAEARRTFKIDKRWSDETVGRRWREHLARMQDRGALADSAQIVAIGAATPAGIVTWHSLGTSQTPQITGVMVHAFDGEAAMLAAVAGWLREAGTPETVIAGHHIIGFDLPSLRLRMLRAGVDLPPILSDPDADVCDTMTLFCRRFSHHRDIMIGLGDACEAVGLAAGHKNTVNGADVGQLVESGNVAALLSYLACDVAAESALFRKLTGIAS